MSPSADTILRRLRSESPTERLEAARYLADHALPEHETIIREAAANEPVRWIRSALRRAVARISPNPEASSFPTSVDKDDLPAGFAAQVYAEALETTASQLMHEIEPLLGGLRLAAETEIENFDASATRRGLDRLDQFLEALSRLRRAASAPRIEEFALDEAIIRCIEEAQLPEGLQIQRPGPRPCIVEGDSGLVSLAFTNGLRNAIEATAALGGGRSLSPIVVTWGTTNVEYWVSIVDAGIGFKGNLQRAFDIGTTTKSGHLGMGLAIAHQSLASMGGQVFLVPNERGVRFEMRWPKKTD
ncbi:sensor histidine kinase [Bradyrhizobium mercantei]|uniref:sensor histidine kinase n=1 Tax=Bradyrhizobium mercantei TaxID=1904807 RepID=UPI000975D28A|nr:HAMP domain-containing sensor histidine kinase [Bradyrhizobium mercantei]